MVTSLCKRVKKQVQAAGRPEHGFAWQALRDGDTDDTLQYRRLIRLALP
jgi:hypothetical protein